MMAYDNRTNILKQALQLFAARGYDAVGVQEIVEAAEITKPTLYHYFGNKRGLLDALLAEQFAPLNDKLAAATIYQHDITCSLQQVVATFFTFAREHPTFYRMQLSMFFAPPHSAAYGAIHGYHDQQHAMLARMFAQAADQHGNMRGRQERYAVTLRGMIDTYISLGLNGRITLDDQVIYEAVHQFMHGIFS